MKQYFLISKYTWDEVFTYRLNFVMYRLRNILTFFTMYYLWLALLPADRELFGYTASKMLTYVFGSALIQSFVLASRSNAMGDDIISGNLSNFLIKPLNYFYYWFAKDIGDKAMNLVFSIAELSIIILVLKPPLLINISPLYLLFFLIASVNALFLYFLFNLILGMIGFWSPEVWAPRFIFMILIGFFSGSYFPLDILPKAIFLFFKYLPFQFLSYFPLSIYLKQLSLFEMIYGISVGIIWSFILVVLVRLVWQKGVREYTAQGR